MRFWYRLMVGTTAMLVMVFTAGMVTANVKLLRAAERQHTVFSEECFNWSNGVYGVTGSLSGGVLEHMVLYRLS